MFHVPEKFRVKTGQLATTAAAGNNGAFIVTVGKSAPRARFKVIASDGEGWEHVSVSAVARTPTWEEMCAIKDLFWDEEDCVIQYHPPRSDYVNNHANCLHLWRPIGVELPRPARILVGI